MLCISNATALIDKIYHISSTNKKVNNTDSLLPSGCNGTNCKTNFTNRRRN